MSDVPLVLVIDDSPELHALVRVALGRAGYDVRCAEDGASGVTAARTLRPELILLDVLMPGLSGFDTLRQLRDDAATRSVPIFMLTAQSTMGDVERALSCGADDYIAKPMTLPQLRVTLDRKFRAYAARRRLAAAVA